MDGAGVSDFRGRGCCRLLRHFPDYLQGARVALWRRREELRSLGIDVLLVSFEPLQRVRLYASDDGFGWPVLADESRTAYRSYGLSRASFVRTWLSPRTTLYYARALLRGTRPRRPVSDAQQLGGDFLIDPEGRIVLAFRSSEPADRPTVGTILEARLRRNEPGSASVQ